MSLGAGATVPAPLCPSCLPKARDGAPLETAAAAARFMGGAQNAAWVCKRLEWGAGNPLNSVGRPGAPETLSKDVTFKWPNRVENVCQKMFSSEAGAWCLQLRMTARVSPASHRGSSERPGRRPHRDTHPHAHDGGGQAPGPWPCSVAVFPTQNRRRALATRRFRGPAETTVRNGNTRLEGTAVTN